MKAEGVEEEREGFDRVFHFVESYSITDHCVPLASIRLFGHTCSQTHTCSPCVRCMEDHIEVHLSFHAVNVQERRNQTDHHATGCYIKARFEVCLK